MGTVDEAQAAEEQDRERAMQRHRQAASHQPRDMSVDGICIDCEEPIEPERLAALAHKTSRCASCAHDFEYRNRGFRR